jgi:hypothetical protein
MAYIRRFRFNGPSETIKTGLTVAEAQEWCSRDDTHGVNPDGTVLWFDGYELDPGDS